MTLLEWFTLCLTGPTLLTGGSPSIWFEPAYNENCVTTCAVDYDHDLDVDLRDFATLQNMHHRS